MYLYHKHLVLQILMIVQLLLNKQQLLKQLNKLRLLLINNKLFKHSQHILVKFKQVHILLHKQLRLYRLLFHKHIQHQVLILLRQHKKLLFHMQTNNKLMQLNMLQLEELMLHLLHLPFQFSNNNMQYKRKLQQVLLVNLNNN